MTSPPKAVIHINFMPEVLLFEPRRIWTALSRAEKSGKIGPLIRKNLQQELGPTAIHLATRNYIIRAALNQLKQRFAKLGNLIPDRWIKKDELRVIGNKHIFEERDYLLLAIDSFLFEIRAYLELLAKFTNAMYCNIGQKPPAIAVLSDKRKVVIRTRTGKFNSHAFLLFLNDRFSLPANWYDFLTLHRNFFTHEAAPYIAIEDRLLMPPEYDLIIMRANIHEFAKANPKDYFRLSECQKVVQGLKKLASRAQEDLVARLET